MDKGKKIKTKNRADPANKLLKNKPKDAACAEPSAKESTKSDEAVKTARKSSKARAANSDNIDIKQSVKSDYSVTSPKGKLVNQKEACEIFNISKPTLNEWVRQGCPVKHRGGKGHPSRYDSAAIFEWRLNKVYEDANGSTEAVLIEEAKRRKMAADAEMAEMNLAERKELLISIPEMIEEVGEQLSRVRSQLLAVPSKLAVAVQHLDKPAEIEKVVKRYISDAMREITGLTPSAKLPGGKK